MSKPGMMLTASPILKPLTPSPMAATFPAASYGDGQEPRPRDVLAGSEHHLGAVHSERMDADLNLAFPRRRDLDPQDFGIAGLVLSIVCGRLLAGRIAFLPHSNLRCSLPSPCSRLHSLGGKADSIAFPKR
jgi:hypothetical protein